LDPLGSESGDFGAYYYSDIYFVNHQCLELLFL